MPKGAKQTTTAFADVLFEIAVRIPGNQGSGPSKEFFFSGFSGLSSFFSGVPSEQDAHGRTKNSCNCVWRQLNCAVLSLLVTKHTS